MLVTVAFATFSSVRAAKPDESLLLDVIVNGRSIGRVGEFKLHGETLSATRAELESLGLKIAPGAPEEPIAVDKLPGLSSRFDSAKQTVSFTASNDAQRPNVLQTSDNDATGIPVESGLGGVLNYNLFDTQASNRTQIQALLDGRVFSPWGVLSSNALGRTGVGTTRAVRLDTTYTYSDPDTLQRVRVGDVISSGFAWTRPLRLGGAQFARDFSLRPDLVTFPIPNVAGQVAVPSTVDVLINGVQALSTQANPGPFEVRRLPIVNGVNDVAVVVNNALGQQVTQTLPIYVSSSLLASGLDAFSVETGSVRLNYGSLSDDYRVPAGSASYRRGITDWLTLSGHVEAAEMIGMGGAGAAVSLGSWGSLSGAMAGSATHWSSGMLGYAEYERITHHFSLSTSFQTSSSGFRDLASLYGDHVPTRAVRASIGVPIGKFGNFGLSYVRQRRQIFPGAGLADNVLATGFGQAANGPTPGTPVRNSLVSASYSVPLLEGRVSFYATGFHDFVNRSGSGLLFGLTMPLGQRSSISASAGQSGEARYGTIQATRSAANVGEVGGQVYASGGDGSRVLASTIYKSPWSLLELDADRSHGHVALRTSASGAIVVAGGNVFATNVVPDSFAVVDTGETAGVQVFYENRPVERSGPSGQVLIPTLRSFEKNLISIDPSDLPLDTDFQASSRVIRPADRSGVVLDFRIKQSHAAIVHLVDQKGTPLPVGSTIRVEPSGAVAPVGFGGEAFVRDLTEHARLEATVPEKGICRAQIVYKPKAGDIPDLGVVACVPVAPP